MSCFESAEAETTLKERPIIFGHDISSIFLSSISIIGSRAWIYIKSCELRTINLILIFTLHMIKVAPMPLPYLTTSPWWIITLGGLWKWKVDKMASWQNGKVWKQRVDKMAVTTLKVGKMLWRANNNDGKLSKWQVNKIEKWQFSSLKMASQQKSNLTEWKVNIMATWCNQFANCKLTKWQLDKIVI